MYLIKKFLKCDTVSNRSCAKAHLQEISNFLLMAILLLLCKIALKKTSYISWYDLILMYNSLNRKIDIM